VVLDVLFFVFSSFFLSSYTWVLCVCVPSLVDIRCHSATTTTIAILASEAAAASPRKKRVNLILDEQFGKLCRQISLYINFDYNL
jgi:hypothetical protein